MDFEILFDNGGGILLITDNFCHSYDRADYAAEDVAELLSSDSTDHWQGNQPEYRREEHAEDDSMTMTAARLILNGEQWVERGAAWNAFCRELAKFGRDSQAAATAK